MSGRLLRLVCTAAVTAAAVCAPVTAVAAPGPTAPEASEASPVTTAPDAGPSPHDSPDNRPLSRLLTDLQQLYREAEAATETYNATAERLKERQAETGRLEDRLAKARLSLQDSRGAVGRLARQQYQNSSQISPYIRLLLARDPQHALEEGHVIGQLAQERVETVDRLADRERTADTLARAARKALDDQLTLTARQKKDRDTVGARLADVERLLASLTPEQLARLTRFEQEGAEKAQQEFMASGALGEDGKGGGRAPSKEGDRAVRYAVRQLGKPYEWGAEGPTSYDCSGLTSRAWEKAGRTVPRTSQEQWAELPHVPLTELRPGDLVIYFPEATHVALYAGNGMVVQAPRPGTTVKVSPIAANPVLGAVRPDPEAAPLADYAPPAAAAKYAAAFSGS